MAHIIVGKFNTVYVNVGYFGGNTVAISNPPVNISQTWNNAAVTFTGILLNITDTASAAASLLMDLQVDGISRFNVRKDGLINSAGNFVGQSYTAAATKFFYWAGRSIIASSADGYVELTNQAQNDFTGLRFGGTTSSFPMLYKNGTVLEHKLADGSDFCGIKAKTCVLTGLGAFAVSDKYVVVDSSGNLHVSALGPAS